MSQLSFIPIVVASTQLATRIPFSDANNLVGKLVGQSCVCGNQVNQLMFIHNNDSNNDNNSNSTKKNSTNNDNNGQLSYPPVFAIWSG